MLALWILEINSVQLPGQGQWAYRQKKKTKNHKEKVSFQRRGDIKQCQTVQLQNTQPVILQRFAWTWALKKKTVDKKTKWFHCVTLLGQSQVKYVLCFLCVLMFWVVFSYSAFSHVCFKRRSINKTPLDWTELSEVVAESKAVGVYFYLDSPASLLINNNMDTLRKQSGEKRPYMEMATYQ